MRLRYAWWAAAAFCGLMVISGLNLEAEDPGAQYTGSIDLFTVLAVCCAIGGFVAHRRAHA